MNPVVVLIVYSIAIVLASLAGGWVPIFIQLTHARMQIAISCVAGVMLGVGVLHLLPHAALELGSLDTTVTWLLIGLVSMFFVERFFCFHHHDAPDAEGIAECGHDSEGHTHHHHHSHDHPGEPAPPGHRLHWAGAATGLALHSIMDGIALAASIEAESGTEHHGYLVGIATFFGIALHKPFDSLAIGTLMAAGGWARRHRHLVNLLFALLLPLGALLFHFGLSQFGDAGAIVGRALAFSAGTFLCISLSDLLPELQFHQHDRIKLSCALLLGLAAAWAIGIAEGAGHGHGGHSGHEHHSHD